MWPIESPGNSGKETRLVSEIFEDYDDKENKEKKDKFRETCAQREYEIENIKSIWNLQLIKWFLYSDFYDKVEGQTLSMYCAGPKA